MVIVKSSVLTTFLDNVCGKLRERSCPQYSTMTPVLVIRMISVNVLVGLSVIRFSPLFLFIKIIVVEIGKAYYFLPMVVYIQSINTKTLTGF